MVPMSFIIDSSHFLLDAFRYKLEQLLCVLMLPRREKGVMFAWGVIDKSGDDIKWANGMISCAR